MAAVFEGLGDADSEIACWGGVRRGLLLWLVVAVKHHQQANKVMAEMYAILNKVQLGSPGWWVHSILDVVPAPEVRLNTVDSLCHNATRFFATATSHATIPYSPNNLRKSSTSAAEIPELAPNQPVDLQNLSPIQYFIIRALEARERTSYSNLFGLFQRLYLIVV